MIIALSGPDDYRREKKKRAIIAEFRVKHPSGIISHVDCESENALGNLRAFAGNQTMFGSSRLAVLSSLFEMSGGEKTLKECAAFMKTFASRKDAVILISESKKPPKQFAFLTAEEKGSGSIIQSFNHLEGAAWAKFVNEEAKQHGVELQGEAAKELVVRYAKDAWRLATELEKLAFLGKKTLSVEDLERAEFEPAPNFFAMLYGLKAPRIADRMKTLEKLFALREPAAKTFHILAYQSGSAISRFAMYDVLVKSGKLEYEEALLDAVLG